MTKINNATLAWNEAGTPVSEAFDDVYFSNVNGLAESRYVFIEQNGLPQRFLSHDRDRFVVAETGFGTGLNFLALCQVYLKAASNQTLPKLHFISFEKFPVTQSDLVKAHQHWPELAEFAIELQKQYPRATPGCHRLSFFDGAITLDLWFGDIKDCMPQVPTPQEGVVDAWFLDGFAPSKNPDMWTQSLFNGMVNLGRSGCTVATFTAAGFVRRGLIEAGFSMSKVKGFGTKREMLAGHLESANPHTNIADDMPRPISENNSDIAIIGGGIASLSLAHSLLQRGHKVTLYCKDEQLATGASKNSQGAIYPLLSNHSAAIQGVFSSAYQYALRFYKGLELEFDHNWCGVVQLMWDQKQTDKLTALASLGLPGDIVTHLSRDETNQVTGLQVDTESLHYPMGGWLAPQQLVQALGTSLQDNPNFTLRLGHEITDLIQRQEGDNALHWTLMDAKGAEHSHASVVVANGHLFDTLAATQHLPLGKVKGQVSAIPSGDRLAKLKTVLCYEGYLTPQSPLDGRHRIGASFDRDNIDEEFDPQAQQQNRDKLARCLPLCDWVNEVDVSENIAKQGIRCVSRDHLPFIGSVMNFDELKQLPLEAPIDSALQPNLYAMVGLGARGLTTAPLLAEVLTSQICGDPLPLNIEELSALDPNRMWVNKRRKGKAL